MLAPANGSAPVSRLATGWREASVFAWSPDSASIAAVLGPELGPKRLVLIDVVTGAQQTIAPWLLLRRQLRARKAGNSSMAERRAKASRRAATSTGSISPSQARSTSPPRARIG